MLGAELVGVGCEHPLGAWPLERRIVRLAGERLARPHPRRPHDRHAGRLGISYTLRISDRAHNSRSKGRLGRRRTSELTRSRLT